jgi:hypothetical protein
MNVLKVINPHINTQNNFSIKLSIISEGYVDQQSFLNDCFALHQKILSHTPFNILADASFIESHLCYIPTEHHGPYTQAFNNTLKLNFDTVLDEQNERLTLNHSILNNILTELKLLTAGSSDDSSSQDSNQGIIVILSPGTSANGTGGSFEYRSQSKVTPSFVATTTDGYWEQVVIRAMCRYLGLGDEFELDGADFREPEISDGFYIDEAMPNLIYDPTTLESMDFADTKWQVLIPSVLKNQEQEIHRHTNHPLLADETFSLHSSISGNVLWEGGGGFRTKIYRYAHDCLMRRRIGSKNLPIKTSKVPLCHICESYMRHKIMQGAKTKSGEPLYFKSVSRPYNLG